MNSVTILEKIQMRIEDLQKTGGVPVRYAALLWYDYDNLPEKEKFAKFNGIQAELMMAAKRRDIPFNTEPWIDEHEDYVLCEDGTLGYIDPSGEPERVRIRKRVLARWAMTRGEVPEFLRSEIDAIKAEDVFPADLRAEESPSLPFQCPEHLEPWIRLILMGYEKFWRDFDPSEQDKKKAPSNPDVIKWFKGRLVRKDSITGNEIRVTSDVAKVFARLIRPDNAPMGPRKDTEAERRAKDGYKLDEIKSLDFWQGGGK